MPQERFFGGNFSIKSKQKGKKERGPKAPKPRVWCSIQPASFIPCCGTRPVIMAFCVTIIMIVLLSRQAFLEPQRKRFVPQNPGVTSRGKNVWDREPLNSGLTGQHSFVTHFAIGEIKDSFFPSRGRFGISNQMVIFFRLDLEILGDF